MNNKDFQKRINALLGDCSENIINVWIGFAKECVDAEQYAFFTEKPKEEAIEDWLDYQYAELYFIKKNFGEDIAKKILNMAEIPHCLYPYEMKAGADYFSKNYTAEQIAKISVDEDMDFNDIPYTITDVQNDLQIINNQNNEGGLKMSELALKLHENPDIKELLELLSTPGYEGQRREFTSMLNYVGTITTQYNSIMKELADLKEKVGDITDKKTPLTIMIESLSKMMDGIGKMITSLVDSIVNFAKNTLEAVRDTGMSALGAVSETLHIHEGLEAVSKSLEKAAARCENLEQFHHDRVESNFLADFEIPTDFDALSLEALESVYDKLLSIGMDGDLSASENKILNDLIEEVEDMLPESSKESDLTAEQTAELEEGAEI